MRTPRSRSLALLAAGLAVGAGAAGATGSSNGSHVLRVGTWHGIKGQYSSIQAAVDAAKPGDWILVAPGDYHERGDYTGHKNGDTTGGVLIHTPGLHLRGLDRNSVIVDGTKVGATACSSKPADQDFGSATSGGGYEGRNGVVVSKVDHVSIENLTACNFQGGAAEIWFNGGDGSGKVGLGAFHGAYLNATTTYYQTGHPAGAYGIFTSNERGPGDITNTYASNMNDSSYYIGACPDCNAVLDHAHGEGSALGYSGTNSGGHLIIENSEFDNNATGIVTNSQNNDDAPSPQNGACPAGGVGPTGSHSCEVWRNNYVHDNNNPNVPQSGTASLGPVGTGMVVAGGRNDTIVGNRVSNNGAWGILLVPYPDEGPPPAVANCAGGVKANDVCYFDDWGNEVANNVLSHNGFFGNPSNGDLADLSTPPAESPGAPGNCWHGNTDPAGSATSWPVTLQTTQATCGMPIYPDPASTTVLTAEAVCDTGLVAQCPSSPVSNYPALTSVKLLPMPRQESMPDPCIGVPANPWCPRP